MLVYLYHLYVLVLGVRLCILSVVHVFLHRVTVLELDLGWLDDYLGQNTSNRLRTLRL